MKTEVEIDVEIPDGYKIKRIGAPKKGELYIDDCVHKTVIKANTHLRYSTCVIVEKCPKWRLASPQEVLERLLGQKIHVMRARGKSIENIYNMTLQFVYVKDEDGLQQVGWDQVEILEEPS